MAVTLLNTKQGVIDGASTGGGLSTSFTLTAGSDRLLIVFLGFEGSQWDEDGDVFYGGLELQNFEDLVPFIQNGTTRNEIRCFIANEDLLGQLTDGQSYTLAAAQDTNDVGIGMVAYLLAGCDQYTMFKSTTAEGTVTTNVTTSQTPLFDNCCLIGAAIFGGQGTHTFSGQTWTNELESIDTVGTGFSLHTGLVLDAGTAASESFTDTSSLSQSRMAIGLYSIAPVQSAQPDPFTFESFTGSNTARISPRRFAKSIYAYSTSGGAQTSTWIDIQSNQCRIFVSNQGAGGTVYTWAYPARDQRDHTITFTPDHTPATGEKIYFGWDDQRWEGDTDGQRIEAEVDLSTAVLSFNQYNGTSWSTFGSTYDAGTINSGVAWKIRIQDTGTQLRAKLWEASTVEPATWALTGTYTVTPVLGPLYFEFDNGSTTGNKAVSFDNLLMTGRTIATDDFATWTGTNWELYWEGTPGQYPPVVSGGAVTNMEGGMGIVRTETFANDQWAEIDMNGCGSSPAALYIRRDDVNNYEYWSSWNSGNGGQYQLFKYNGTTDTSIGTSVTGVGSTGTRRMRLEAVGDRITYYVDGVEQISTTDTLITSGVPGFAGTASQSAFDNFSAGDWTTGIMDVSAPVVAISATTYTPTINVLTLNYQTRFNANVVANSDNGSGDFTSSGWDTAANTLLVAVVTINQQDQPMDVADMPIPVTSGLTWQLVNNASYLDYSTWTAGVAIYVADSPGAATGRTFAMTYPGTGNWDSNVNTIDLLILEFTGAANATAHTSKLPAAGYVYNASGVRRDPGAVSVTANLTPRNNSMMLSVFSGDDDVASTATPGTGFTELVDRGYSSPWRYLKTVVQIRENSSTSTEVGWVGGDTSSAASTYDYVVSYLEILSALNVIATDDFNRADQSGIGSTNWDTSTSEGTWSIVSNTAVVTEIDGSDARAVWVADSFHPDQWAEADVTLTGAADTSDVNIMLRASYGTLSCYRFRWEPTVGGGQYFITWTNNTGIDTVLATSADGIGETGTRRLRFQAINIGVDDVSLAAYANGAEVLTATHNATQVQQAGYPGIKTDSTTSTKPVIDNFIAGDWATTDVYPVQVWEDASSTTLTHTLTWPSRPQAGNLLVMSVGSRHDYTTYASCTSGFTELARGENTSTSDHTSIFVAVADGTSAYDTFTINYSSITDTAILIGIEFHSVNGSFSSYVTEDTTFENNVTAATDTLPALTIANESLVVAAVGSRTTGASNPILWTGLPRVEYDNVASSSALGVGWGIKSADYTPEWTFATSDTTIGSAAIAIRTPTAAGAGTDVSAPSISTSATTYVPTIDIVNASLPSVVTIPVTIYIPKIDFWDLQATPVDSSQIDLSWNAYIQPGYITTGYDVERTTLVPNTITSAWVTSSTSTADSTSYTFSSTSIGAEDVDRTVIVAVALRNTAAPSISSVTIGGVAATEVATNASTGTRVALYALAVPTGTTANIVVNCTSSLRCGISVYRAIGLLTSSAQYTNTTGSNIPASVAGSVIIGVAATANATATYTWTGLTEDMDSTFGGEAFAFSTASVNTSTNVSASGTPTTFNDGAAVYASWWGAPPSLSVVETAADAKDNGQTVTVPFTAQEGDTVILAGGGASGISFTFTTPGYTQIATQADASGRTLRLYKKVMGSTPDSSVVIQNNSGAAYGSAWAVAVLRGSADSFNVSFATGTASIANPPDIVVPENGVVVTGYLLGYDDIATSAPSGYSNLASDGVLDTNRAGVGIATLEPIVAGLQNPGTFGGLGSRDWVAFTMAVAPTNVLATDNFDRANGGLGANWATDYGSGHSIVNNHVESGSDCRSLWISTLDVDHWAEADVTLTGSGPRDGGVSVRVTAPGTGGGYNFFWNETGRYGIWDDTDGQLIASLDGNGTTGTRRMRIEAVGTTITAYVNGVEVLSVSDATSSSGTYAGFALATYGGGTTAQLDNFSAGDWVQVQVLDYNSQIIVTNHSTNSYSDTGLTASTQYSYRVRAVLEPVFEHVGVTEVYSASAGVADKTSALVQRSAVAGNLLVGAVAVDKISGAFTDPIGWTPIYSVSNTSTSFGMWWRIATGDSNDDFDPSWATASLNYDAHVGEWTAGETFVNAHDVSYTETADTSKTVNLGTANLDGLLVAFACMDTDTASNTLTFIGATTHYNEVGSHDTGNGRCVGGLGSTLVSAGGSQSVQSSWHQGDQNGLVVVKFTAPTVIATDDFNRANGGLGSNWTTITGESAPQISSNAVSAPSNTVVYGAYWSADTFNDDQWAEADCTLASDYAEVSLNLRVQSGADTYYTAIWASDLSGRYKIQECTSGTYVTLASSSGVGTTARTLRFEAIGSTLILYADGVEVLSTTDSTITSGVPGIGVYKDAGTPTLDNFSAGDWT